MRPAALILGLLASGSALAGSFQIQTAYPSDPAGNAISPRLGEPFWMTVRYRIDQAAWGSMRVSSPWDGYTSGAFMSQAGNQQATYGPLIPLFDGPIPVQVVIGDAQTQVSVAPISPSRPVEYHSPQAWQADFGASLQFKAGQSSKVEWLVPKPPSFGFQNVFPGRLYLGQAVTPDVRLILNVSQVESSFQTESRSVRVNAAALKQVKFDALRTIPNDVKAFLKTELYIQPGDQHVKRFVTMHLPGATARSLGVYESARVLYQGVVAKIRYVENPGAPPSASQALRTGFGDCGFFASAFTAACRSIGIPARPITGFLAGSNEWHVWAEFYVPGHGWIPVDPSFADGKDPDGRYPLYFGVIPDLNQRVATAIGFDHSFSYYRVPILQSPFAITDTKKVQSAFAWCNLVRL